MPRGGRVVVETAPVELGEGEAAAAPRGAASRRAVRAARGERQRARHGPRDGKPRVRAVLHDQGGRQGDGPRAVHRVRNREAVGWICLGRVGARPGHDLRIYLPFTEAALPSRAPPPSGARPRGPRRCWWRRTSPWSVRWRSGRSSRPATRCWRWRAATAALRAVRGAERTDPPGPHRRGDGGRRWPRAWPPARGDPARPSRALHERPPGGRDRPPRACTVAHDFIAKPFAPWRWPRPCARCSTRRAQRLRPRPSAGIGTGRTRAILRRRPVMAPVASVREKRKPQSRQCRVIVIGRSCWPRLRVSPRPLRPLCAAPRRLMCRTLTVGEREGACPWARPLSCCARMLPPACALSGSSRRQHRPQGVPDEARLHREVARHRPGAGDEQLVVIEGGQLAGGSRDGRRWQQEVDGERRRLGLMLGARCRSRSAWDRGWPVRPATAPRAGAAERACQRCASSCASVCRSWASLVMRAGIERERVARARRTRPGGRPRARARPRRPPAGPAGRRSRRANRRRGSP